MRCGRLSDCRSRGPGSTCCRIETSPISFPTLKLCLSEKTITAVGLLYLVQKHTEEDIMHSGVVLVLGTLVASSAFVDGFTLWGGNDDTVPKGRCAGKEFNFRRELCCGGQLYPRETGTESCCGYKLLDTVEEKCCNGFVIEFHDRCLIHPVKHDSQNQHEPI
ncbi:hypothetical protein LSAT2_009070 [Lamellibrachia satsuma]|nr:hypothetical protein LSAT2_009070 [Lamellibrachia satsuma]